MGCPEPSMPLEDFVEQMCDELEVPYAKVGPPVCDEVTAFPHCTKCRESIICIHIYTH